MQRLRLVLKAVQRGQAITLRITTLETPTTVIAIFARNWVAISIVCNNFVLAGLRQRVRWTMRLFLPCSRHEGENVK
jgi:hypothetical protein